MIRVLIADDERLMLQGFIHSIKWIEHGYEIIGTAENGAQALELCNSLLPDIAVLDINMPEMSGLELIKELKALYPDLIIIILTAYDDFRFAREAIRLKADEYLLKPEIEFEDILEVMNRFRERIEQKKHLAIIKPNDDKQKLLRCLLDTETININTIEGELERTGIKFPCCTHYLYIIMFDREDKGYLIGEIEHKIPSKIEQLLNCEFLYLKYDENTVVLVAHDVETRAVSFYLSDIPEAFAHELKLLGFSNFRIGISNAFKAINEITNAFSQARKALEMMFYNKKILYSYNEVNESIIKSAQYSKELQQISTLLEVSNYSELRVCIHKLFAIIRSQTPPKQTVVRAFFDIAFSFIRKLNESGYNIDEVLSAKSFNPYMEISSCKDFSELESWIKEFMEKAIECLIKNCEKEYKNIVYNMKQYIHENYNNENFTLNTLASYLHVSYGYLSVLFNKEVGESFNKYLAKLRIEKAKKLMLNDKTKLYEISEAVGFKNMSYFIKVFKKHTGITPLEYKNSVRNESGNKLQD